MGKRHLPAENSISAVSLLLSAPESTQDYRKADRRPDIKENAIFAVKQDNHEVNVVMKRVSPDFGRWFLLHNNKWIADASDSKRSAPLDDAARPGAAVITSLEFLAFTVGKRVANAPVDTAGDWGQF